MGSLTLQTIIWCFVGFAVGALAAWLVAVMLFPHEKAVTPGTTEDVPSEDSDAAEGAADADSDHDAETEDSDAIFETRRARSDRSKRRWRRDDEEVQS